MEASPSPKPRICSICSELLIQPGNDPVAASCGHVFHRRCIEKTIRRSGLCPSCQAPILAETLISLHFTMLKSGDNISEVEKENFHQPLTALNDVLADLEAIYSKIQIMEEDTNEVVKQQVKDSEPKTRACSNCKEIHDSDSESSSDHSESLDDLHSDLELSKEMLKSEKRILLQNKEALCNVSNTLNAVKILLTTANRALNEKLKGKAVKISGTPQNKSNGKINGALGNKSNGKISGTLENKSNGEICGTPENKSNAEGTEKGEKEPATVSGPVDRNAGEM